MKECSPDHGIAIPLEEYHHYNSQKAGDPLWVVAPAGASVPRALDTLREGRRVGGSCYLVHTAGAPGVGGVGRGRLQAAGAARAARPAAVYRPDPAVRLPRGDGEVPGGGGASVGVGVVSGPRLLCVGNLTVDDVVLPSGVRRDGCVGGGALYSALAARLFEPRTAMLAPVGSDLPSAVASRIAAAGFDVAALPRRAVPTIRNVVTYDAAGGRSWELLGTDEQFDALAVRPSDVGAGHARADAVLCTAMSLAAQSELTRWLRRATAALIVLDLQEDYIPGDEERVLAMAADSHVFMPSEEEVRRLTGSSDWEVAAQAFAALGPRRAVVKLGAEGALVHDAVCDRTFVAPAVDVPVTDTTGAGDAYCGGFAAALIDAPDDLVAAAATGVAAASFAVEGYGADRLLGASPGEAAARRECGDRHPRPVRPTSAVLPPSGPTSRSGRTTPTDWLIPNRDATGSRPGGAGSRRGAGVVAACATAGVLLGRLLGRRRWRVWARGALTGGTAGFAVVTLGIGLAGSVGAVGGLRFLHGVGFALVTSAVVMAVAGAVDEARRPDAITRAGLAMSLSMRCSRPWRPWPATDCCSSRPLARCWGARPPRSSLALLRRSPGCRQRRQCRGARHDGRTPWSPSRRWAPATGRCWTSSR